MLATDLWRVGIVRAPMAALLDQDRLDRAEIVWLPEGRRLTYLADPFGLWRNGVLHVFVEAYDYRTRRGTIELVRLDATLALIDHAPCLAEPWHLSYPFVFEADGETYLLPEAYKSGALTLYRAIEFPHRWAAAARIALDAPAIDATPFRHEGLWWLAYAPGGGDIAARQGRLHLAWAERLTGPWRPHPGNPVRIDRAGARPGGSVMFRDERPILPVQDCSITYGGRLRLLAIKTLTPDRFEAQLAAALAPGANFGRYRDGLHTLSACGPVTLIDAKRTMRSLARVPAEARAIARRFIA